MERQWLTVEVSTVADAGKVFRGWNDDSGWQPLKLPAVFLLLLIPSE
jgi:hypothetical protein